MRLIQPSSNTALGLLALLLLAAGCSGGPAEEVTQVVAEAQTKWPDIDITRSLAVTDLPTLGALDAQGHERFSLARVLAKIAATSATNATGREIYRRMFDTNNTRAGGFFADGQHCDDQKDASGHAVLNGFPLECPRQEGALAAPSGHDPFCAGPGCDPYSPIAITNRFDLSPDDGETCGQYRIVFGKGAGQSPVATAGVHDLFDRNLVIFEAVLKNPHPGAGLPGCAPVMEFWAGLSALSDPAQRAAALDRFFFTGLPGFGPVIHYANYTGATNPANGVQISGQIRANQFMNKVGGQMWQLREYNLDRACSLTSGSFSCGVRVRLVPPKVNPAATLFDDGNQSPVAISFRDAKNPGGFIAQVPALATGDLNLLNMNGLYGAYNGPQSTSSPSFFGSTPVQNDANYAAYFNPSGPFAAKIQSALDRIGSKVTPLQIVRRAQSQACAGCHELATSTAPFFGGAIDANKLGPSGASGGDLVWPDAALVPPPPGSPPGTPAAGAFTQTSEIVLLPLAKGVTCDAACTAHPTTCQCAWELSPAMTEVFLPFRKWNMVTFLERVKDTTADWTDDWAPAATRMHGSPDN